MIELINEGLKIGQIRGENDDSPHHDRFVVTKGVNCEETPPGTRFLFVSETCLPIVPIDEVERVMYGDENAKVPFPAKSWINAQNSPNNGYARQLQWDKIASVISQDKIWKADQWMLLTRSHAQNSTVDAREGLKGNRPLWNCFKNTKASDEMYFPTGLALMGVLEGGKGNVLGENMVKRRVTYCDWSDGAKNPASFCNVKEFKEVVQMGKKEGCLFARKFAPRPGDSLDLPVEGWATVVLGLDFDKNYGFEESKLPLLSE